MTIEWLAGFVDGEGCIRLGCPDKHRKAWYPELTIVQRDRAVLDRIRDFLGCGNVFGPSKCRHPFFSYKLSATSETEAVLRLLLPHLQVKQEQVEILLESLEFPPTERENFAKELSQLKKRPPCQT